MNKLKILTSALVILLSMNSCKVFLFSGKISKSDAYWDLDKSANRKYFRKQRKAPSIDMTTMPTEHDVAKAYLGSVYVENVKNPLPTPCVVGSDLFKDYVQQKFNLVFTYTYSFASKFDVGLNVDTDFNSIIKENPGLDEQKKKDIKAKLNAAYSKYKQNGLKVQGRMFLYDLAPEALTKLVDDQGFNICIGNIRSKNKYFIYQIGLLKYDFDYVSHSLEQIEMQLRTELSDIVGTANVTLSFKSSAQADFQSSVRGGYQIIYWDAAQPQWLDQNKPRLQLRLKNLMTLKEVTK